MSATTAKSSSQHSEGGIIAGECVIKDGVGFTGVRFYCLLKPTFLTTAKNSTINIGT